MKFKALEIKDITLLQNLASFIWNENYLEMISKSQIDYMLTLMYSKNQIQKDIFDKHFWYIVYEEDEAIGYVHFYPKTNMMFLSKIYLKKGFQGKGISKNMLNLVEEKANELNLNSIQLTVNKTNQRAINFYTKNGFILKQKILTKIGEGFFMDDYIFELDIK